MAEDKEEKKQAESPPQAQSVDELAECQRLRDEYLAGWQRARADFINYQKQESERLSQIIMFANEGLIADLLVVLDSFDLAIAHAQTEAEKKSYELIQSQIMNLLKKNGLEQVKAEPGDKFDANQHEVVETIKDKDKVSGVISEVVSRGYVLRGKIIRAARVKINE
jgi:molecular chaperone GrpE